MVAFPSVKTVSVNLTGRLDHTYKNGTKVKCLGFRVSGFRVLGFSVLAF
jgi:hypothetical protein